MKAELRQEWEPRLLLFADCHYPSALFSYQQSYSCYQFQLILTDRTALVHKYTMVFLSRWGPRVKDRPLSTVAIIIDKWGMSQNYINYNCKYA